jgi:integrase
VAVKKIGERKWQTIAWDTSGLKKVQRRRNFATKKEAEKYEHELAAKRRARRLGELAESFENPTLGVWADRYLGAHSHVRDTTRENLERRFRVLTKTFGDVPLQDIDREMIGRWVREVLAPDYAWNTQRSHLAALKQLLGGAVRDGLLTRNPASDVRLTKRQRPEIHPFASWEEVETVATLAGSRYGALIRFIAATGLRQQEALALRWGDLRRGERRLQVNRTVQGGRIVEGEAKNAGSLRTIVLPRRALDALPSPEGDPDALIFTRTNGARINGDVFRLRHWQPAMLRSGLKYRPPHQLRHTFATLALSQRPPIPVTDVSRQLGHKDISTTLDYYFRFTEPMAERLEEMLNEGDS